MSSYEFEEGLSPASVGSSQQGTVRFCLFRGAVRASRDAGANWAVQKKYKSLLPGKAEHPLPVLKQQGKKPKSLIIAPPALTLWFLTSAAALNRVQEPMVECTVKCGQGLHLPQRFCSSGKHVRDVESYLFLKSR